MKGQNQAARRFLCCLWLCCLPPATHCLSSARPCHATLEPADYRLRPAPTVRQNKPSLHNSGWWIFSLSSNDKKKQDKYTYITPCVMCYHSYCMNIKVFLLSCTCVAEETPHNAGPFLPRPALSPRQLNIGHSERIYASEIGCHCDSGIFPPGERLLNMYQHQAPCRSWCPCSRSTRSVPTPALGHVRGALGL